MLKAARSAISRIVIFDPRFPSMYSRTRLACQAARPPGRKMPCDGGASMPVAPDSLPRSVDASLRHRQATSRFDSKQVIARISRCPARAEASTRMFLTGEFAWGSFSFLVCIFPLLREKRGQAILEQLSHRQIPD